MGLVVIVNIYFSIKYCNGLVEGYRKMSFHKEKMILRGYWKKVKVGMLQLEEIPEPYKSLILRYYYKEGY